jgi:hypothetical protein
LLSFANVYFFESGLFNGLQPIQIKISCSIRFPKKSGAPVSRWLANRLEGAASRASFSLR